MVVEATDLVGHALGLGQGWQQKGGENRYNGDDYQQLDQGKPQSTPMPGWLFCFHDAFGQAGHASRG